MLVLYEMKMKMKDKECYFVSFFRVTNFGQGLSQTAPSPSPTSGRESTISTPGFPVSSATASTPRTSSSAKVSMQTIPTPSLNRRRSLSVMLGVPAGSQIDLGDLLYEPLRDGPTLWEIGVPDRTAAEFFVPDPNPEYVNKLYLQGRDR